MLNGIMNIYKEAGYTSHDVVAKMRGICGQKKIGHTGTLDPAAVGVLPVCLGSGTKLCGMLTDEDKEYEAELLLGVSYDTQDTTGSLLESCRITAGSEQVRSCILSFQGKYLQTPPMYSALKVGGKRLYELARAGIEVERSPRPVEIKEIEILDMNLPLVKIRVVCSKGTYIRTLCSDIGDRLGCGGAMAYLKRTRVGIFRAEDAITLRGLEQLKEEGRLLEKLVRSDSLFNNYPALHVKNENLRLVMNGNLFSFEHTTEAAENKGNSDCSAEANVSREKYFGNKDHTENSGEIRAGVYSGRAHKAAVTKNGVQVRVYDEAGHFYGIYGYEESRKSFVPVKMFPEI